MVDCVAFSPNGAHIASGCFDRIVSIWETASGTKLAHLEGHQGHVSSVAFSSDGMLIASGSDDETVRVWDAGSKDCLDVIRGLGGVAVNIRQRLKDEVGEMYVIREQFLESIIEIACTGKPVAYFPQRLRYCTTTANDFCWIGHFGKHIGIIKLEKTLN
tara:strand:- start:786 stop:1262 length:477 start_codon:yes stop_codon:yes gene_type:complete